MKKSCFHFFNFVLKLCVCVFIRHCTMSCGNCVLFILLLPLPFVDLLIYDT